MNKYNNLLDAMKAASEGDFIVRKSRKNVRVFKSANTAFIWGGGYRNNQSSVYYMKSANPFSWSTCLDIFIMYRLAKLTREIERAKAARWPDRTFADSLGYYIYE